jgi:hypothetical protein
VTKKILKLIEKNIIIIMNSPSITLFITEEDLKTVFTTVQHNVDSSLITPWIQAAQQIHIEHRLGKPLSEAIKAEIEADTLVDPYRELVEQYIAPALAWWSFYEAIPSLHMKYTAKGIVLKTSDNSSSVSLEELSLGRGQARDFAEFYENRMINYLKDNPTLFPLYREDCIVVNRNVFRAGIMIPRKNLWRQK